LSNSSNSHINRTGVKVARFGIRNWQKATDALLKIASSQQD